MQLGEISFCDKVGYNIRSDDVKKRVLRELEYDYCFKVIQRHHEKYQRHIHDQILTNNPHMVCTRTNGNPYLLYLTRVNFVNQCIFIDKKIQQGYTFPRMIVAKLWFADELFQNTLFEGEMVKDDNGKWTFLIGDLIADSGTMLQSQNLTKRINRIYQILKSQYVRDSINICDIKVKKYFNYNQIPYILNDYQNELDYKIRGIYFKPLFLKFHDILYNFDDSLIVQVKRVKFKDQGAFLIADENAKQIEKQIEKTNTCIRQEIPLKPALPTHTQLSKSSNTIVSNEVPLWVMRTEQTDMYEVHDEHKKLGHACVNRLSTSKLLQMLFQHSTPLTKIKMICKFHDKFQKWEPLRQAN